MVKELTHKPNLQMESTVFFSLDRFRAQSLFTPHPNPLSIYGQFMIKRYKMWILKKDAALGILLTKKTSSLISLTLAKYQ